jgi:hypothetical protein
MLTIVYENLLGLINIILVIAIVKPIAAQNCTSCTPPAAAGTANITVGTSPITGCATIQLVCPEGSIAQIIHNGGSKS